MKFVDEIHVWYRSYSANIIAILGILSGLNGFFNFAAKLMPGSWVFYAIAVICAVAWIARWIKQPAMAEAMVKIKAWYDAADQPGITGVDKLPKQ